MALSDTDDIVALLQTNDGEYITNMINATRNIGTSPLGDAYGCMLTSRMIPVLNNMTGFLRKFQYGTGAIDTLASEWGGINNIRFFVSSQGSVSPNASLMGNDVANCFVTAKEGYKVVWQAGGKARFIYLPPGYNNDPLVTESQQYVDLKSFLMGLNILPRNGEDNKAQAEQYALAA